MTAKNKRKQIIKIEDNKLIDDFINDHICYLVKTGKNELKCSNCGHVNENIVNLKCGKNGYCNECLAEGKVITPRKEERTIIVIGLFVYEILYKHDVGYKLLYQEQVFHIDEQGNKFVRHLFNHFGNIVFRYNRDNNWRQVHKTGSFYDWEEDTYHGIKGHMVYTSPFMLYKKEYDINVVNYLYSGASYTAPRFSKRVRKKTLYDLVRKVDREYAAEYARSGKNVLQVIEKGKLDEWIPREKLLSYTGIHNFKGDRFELEKLINFGSKYYVQMYIDEGYSIIENHTKPELKWIKELKNANKRTILLDEMELKVLAEFHKCDYKFITKIIEQKEDFLMLRNFNDVLLAYDHKFGEYKGLTFELPVVPRHLKHESNILHHCVSGYKDKQKTDRFVFFVRYKEGRPYGTVEVDMKKKKVVQARSFKNKALPRKVKNILDSFVQERLFI